MVSCRSTGFSLSKITHDPRPRLEFRLLKNSSVLPRHWSDLGLGLDLMGSAVPQPFHFQWDLWDPLPSSSLSRVGPTPLHVITTAASLRLSHQLRLGFLLRSSFKVPIVIPPLSTYHQGKSHQINQEEKGKRKKD